jgi:protein-tyrosine-phosphatase
MRKILVVCKHNQARSIIIAAVLRRFYGDHIIQSAGTQAKHLGPIPTSIREIADRWGLDIVEDFSQNFLDVASDLTESDLILAADASVAQEITAIDSSRTVVTITDFTPSAELSPRDPFDMDLEATRVELAKAITAAMYAATANISTTANIATLSQRSPQETIRFAKSWQEQSAGAVIDLSLSIADDSLWINNLDNLLRFNPRNLSSLTKIPRKSILIPGFESSESGRLLLSERWKSWLDHIAKEEAMRS